MDLKNVGYKGMDSIHVAQNGVQWRAHMNTVMNLQVP
jgi:hypothetical protein